MSVVHEDVGNEVSDFSTYFSDGDIYLDEEKKIYDALGNRWVGVSAIFSPRTWYNIFQSKKNKDVQGNLKGEGRLLGGVMVVGKGDKGCVYVHREEVIGEFADLAEVGQALELSIQE